jgi:hypothetical protein
MIYLVRPSNMPDLECLRSMFDPEDLSIALLGGRHSEGCWWVLFESLKVCRPRPARVQWLHATRSPGGCVVPPRGVCV